MISSVAAVAQTLSDSLKLTHPPIAICFANQGPPGVKRWTGRVPAGCRFCEEAAREVFGTSPSDHDLCGIGTFTPRVGKMRMKGCPGIQYQGFRSKGEVTRLAYVIAEPWDEIDPYGVAFNGIRFLCWKVENEKGDSVWFL